MLSEAFIPLTFSVLRGARAVLIGLPRAVVPEQAPGDPAWTVSRSRQPPLQLFVLDPGHEHVGTSDDHGSTPARMPAQPYPS